MTLLPSLPGDRRLLASLEAPLLGLGVTPPFGQWGLTAAGVVLLCENNTGGATCRELELKAFPFDRFSTL